MSLNNIYEVHLLLNCMFIIYFGFFNQLTCITILGIKPGQSQLPLSETVT
jgi:hypothetical protein